MSVSSSTPSSTPSPLIVALDYPSAAAALALVARLDPTLCRLKVGSELYTSAGPPLVEQLMRRGFEVFLDLKFHDIPNTVAAACRVAAELGVWMLNVHASGGREMLGAAREALQQGLSRRPLLIGVTVLTSLETADLSDVGLSTTPAEQVLRLAELAADAGLDGVVCSAQEAALLRSRLGKDFVLVTPGIRSQQARAQQARAQQARAQQARAQQACAAANVDDQRRVLSAAEALAVGAHYLVIGRPITQAEDPPTALRAFYDEICSKE